MLACENGPLSVVLAPHPDSVVITGEGAIEALAFEVMDAMISQTNAGFPQRFIAVVEGVTWGLSWRTRQEVVDFIIEGSCQGGRRVRPRLVH